jgi:hypothetical protein
MHRVIGNDDYIVAVNESRVEVKATFRAARRHPALHVVFEDRTVAADQGAFADVFAPRAVRVYASAAQLPPPLVAPTTAPDPGGEPEYITELLKRKSLAAYAGSANWIWYPGKSQTPGADALFAHTFVLPAKATNATLIVSADDFYVCYLNGKEVGKTVYGWARAECYDVAALLQPGTNRLAIAAHDAGFPPCGLLADLTGTTVDGAPIAVITDASWRCAETNTPGWLDADRQPDAWRPVDVLGPYGSGAWGKSVLLLP